MKPAIELDDLSVTIDKQLILSGISATIPSGKIVGLLGPSGAGKTTLIRSILGLQKLSHGSITVLGKPAGARQLRSETGYVTQALSVYPDLTVGENVRYFASLLGLGKDAVKPVLDEVELGDFERRLVSNLSGGQKARVSLAVALLGNPKLLLLDEPTVGLDPVLREKLWHTFANLAEHGVTLLISSHVMDEAEKCDEIAFLRDGRLLASGTQQHILETTKTSDIENAFLKLAKGHTS